jgi:lipid-A-disaccharide synthase
MLSNPSVLIIAGEASGDRHAARLVEEIRRLSDRVGFWGIGGDRLREQGVDTLYDAAEMNVIGFVEVVKRYRFFRSVFDTIVETARRRTPALAILVDYPGFNLRLARALHELGIPVVFYIAPQVWAWKERRVKQIRDYVDDLIVVFPFEVEYFRRHGIAARFFGHPLVEQTSRMRHAIGADAVADGERMRRMRTIAYLPGSRGEEIDRHMPVIADVIATMGNGYRHVIPLASTIARERLERYRGRADFEIADSAFVALAGAGAALVKSGTSTLDALLLDVPCAVFYKTSGASYRIAKRLIKVPFIAMINVLAGRRVVREFIQEEMNAPALVEELRRLLEDEGYRAGVMREMREVHEGLGDAGASERIAAFIVGNYLAS